LVGLAARSRADTLRSIRSLVDPNRDARELFLGEDGELKPAAKRLFARLAKEARINDLAFEPDARMQDHLLGRQFIVRFLGAMLRLDTARLEHLQRQMGDER
jgi:hypothetical protein